ncbi:stalk domain-containing protein [Paenibacillus odorifer]|uniref:stalk domain-containing protein n=1 Tax=Paenibacillus odorifer TaxID=189426 RepID=UPI001C4D350D|nr:stalk domain-containing protein [Paenibacillus odorifer]
MIINGKSVSFEAYNIGGNNYFKLRDLAAAVNGSGKQFSVGWDGSKNAISLGSGQAYTPVGGELAVSANPSKKNATPSDSKIYLDGKELQLTAYNIDGNNYFKLRDIAKAFNIGVTWDGKANTVGIDTKIDYKDE